MWFANPYPVKLVQTRDELIQLNELNTNFRIIHTDGRPHPKNPDPTFVGDATAHWEGDTLVIDVIAIDERTWNNFIGWFHSDQEHVIERLSRPSRWRDARACAELRRNAHRHRHTDLPAVVSGWPVVFDRL